MRGSLTNIDPLVFSGSLGRIPRGPDDSRPSGPADDLDIFRPGAQQFVPVRPFVPLYEKQGNLG
jgi:hypothetical protein